MSVTMNSKKINATIDLDLNYSIPQVDRYIFNKEAPRPYDSIILTIP